MTALRPNVTLSTIDELDAQRPAFDRLTVGVTAGRNHLDTVTGPRRVAQSGALASR